MSIAKPHAKDSVKAKKATKAVKDLPARGDRKVKGGAAKPAMTANHNQTLV